MSRARGVPSLELFTNIAALSGVGIPVGMSVDADTWIVNESEDGPESMTFSTPRLSDAGLHVAEGQVARVRRDDNDYDEWPVAGITIRRGTDAMTSVTCRPLLYRLAECGLVTDWLRNPVDGLPALDWGVSQLTVREILQTYVIDNPDLNTVIPWLQLGTIDPEDVLIDLEVSWVSVLELVKACVAQLETKGRFCVIRLRRVDDTHYELDILDEEEV